MDHSISVVRTHQESTHNTWFTEFSKSFGFCWSDKVNFFSVYSVHIITVLSFPKLLELFGLIVCPTSIEIH